MESWLNQYRQPPGSQGLSDVACEFYVKQMLRGCIPNEKIDRALGMTGTHALLLYGAAGSGKVTLIKALAHEIEKTGDGIFFAQLPIWALMGDSEQETISRICRLFETLPSAAEHLLVAVEAIDELHCQPSAAWMLASCIAGLLAQEMSCTIVMTTNHLQMVPECLLKVAVPCKVEKPDLEARKKYFRQMLEDKIGCERGLTADVMAQMTYGFSYSQLRQCVQMMRLQIKYETMMMGTLKNLTKKGFEALTQNLRQAGSDARSVMVPATEPYGSAVPLAEGPGEIREMTDVLDDDESLMSHWEDLPDELEEW